MNSSEAVPLNPESCSAMPLGTVVSDCEGYWAQMNRHYVKTGVSSWAIFFHQPSAGEIREAIEQEKNVSPMPQGILFHVDIPQHIRGIFSGAPAPLVGASV